MGCCPSSKKPPTVIVVASDAGRNSNLNPNPDPDSNPDQSSSIFVRRLSQRFSLRSKMQKSLTAGTLLKAISNYQSPETTTLTFKTGDFMEKLSDSDQDWYRASHLKTGEEGYVPRTYVVLENSLSAHPWFHSDVSHNSAVRLLIDPECKPGTFLVRESETRPGTYAISVRDEKDGEAIVRHYRIYNMTDGGFYVSPRTTFATLAELIEHYSKNKDGSALHLTKPCAKEKPQLWDLSPEMKDQWEIDRATITLDKRLGQGQFGEVWAGRWNNATPVAVKQLKPGSMTSEAFLAEAHTMKKFRHANIVRLYAVCSVGEPILMVTELLQDSLLNHLRDNDESLTFRILIDFAAQIACGMAYLENGNFIHRDLAARNVLVGDKNTVKVADFGLMRAAYENEYETTLDLNFPIKWMAPEVIHYSRFTVKSDVWSYGIVLIELSIYGATPYPGMTNAEVQREVLKGNRHKKPVQCPNELYKIMNDCWHKEPEQRPTFETLKYTMEDFAVATEGPYQNIVEWPSDLDLVHIQTE